MTLAELQEKYGFDGGNYDPKPDCRFCKGTGEKYVPKLKRSTFCICLFVSHDICEDAGLAIGKVAKEELKRME